MDSKGVYLVVVSTLGFGFAPILAKKGLGGISPLVGGIVSVVAGLLTFSVLILASRNFQGLYRDQLKALPFFCAAGINNTLAVGCFYTALQMSLAIIVVPLTSVFPLVTIALSYLFLREGEGLNRRMVLGALLIIGGVILLNIR